MDILMLLMDNLTNNDQIQICYTMVLLLKKPIYIITQVLINVYTLQNLIV